MDHIPILIYPCISILVLYLLNKKYTYKIKLIKFFGSPSRYKATLIIITLSIFVAFAFFYDKSPFSSPLFTTIYLSYFYLIAIPKELH